MINPREFLNTTAELHALVHGFADTLCPWPPRHPYATTTRESEIQSDYHYYQLGRLLTWPAWFAIAYGIKQLITR